jgi:hypothetical protein
MNKIKLILKGLLPIFITTIGTLTLIGGELDDSPGLGGIGLILICVASYINVKKYLN